MGRRLIDFFQVSIRNRLMVLICLIVVATTGFAFAINITSLQHDFDKYSSQAEMNIRQLKIPESDKKSLYPIAFSKEEVDHFLNRQAIFSSLSTLVCIFTSIALILLVVHAIVDPLRKLAEMVRSKTEVKTTEAGEAAILMARRDEIGLLAEKIHAMTNLLADQEPKVLLGETAAAVAHDIQSPLVVLRIALTRLQSGESDTKIMNLLSISAKRLEQTAQDLLQKYKGVTPVTQTFNLKNIFDDLIEEFSAQFPKVDFSCVGAGKVFLHGNSAKLERAFGNIIKNGLEAMNGAGSLSIKTKLQDGNAKVSITDTGLGIAKEKLSKILQGGFTEGKENGHGIGTKVVREVIEEFGGALTVDSELGKGTTFTITLPVAESGIVDSRIVEPFFIEEDKIVLSPEVSLNGRQGYTVLVVDDDEGILLAWRAMKTNFGVEKLYVYPNLEALQSEPIDFGKIDIAFVDKNIEESAYDGAQVVAFLKDRGVAKIALASGECASDLRANVDFARVDFIIEEKIPKSFSSFFS